MRRFYIIIAFFFVALTAINIYYFRSLYHMQVNQHKNFLFKQSDVCVSEIERTLQKFESDLNYILFSDDIARLFEDDGEEGLRKLQLFYTSYNNLVKNIDIYDFNKNVLNVFRDRKSYFITDRYIAQRQRKLLDKDEIIQNKDEYQYVLPVFRNNELYANILVTVNINQYILSELEKFRLEDITWQWAIDVENGNVYNTSHIQYNWNGELQSILANLSNDREDLFIHEISNDSLHYKILSVYTPVQVLNRKFGIGLSIDHNSFLLEVFSKLAVIAVLSLLIFLLACLILLYQIRSLKKKIIT
ncbi:MAG TPA: hypothetical protein DDX98_11465 [Bacteroidales bacterium]|jgi:predicted transcriptional regulator with HTH domain|nr:hypothetical protein [Bacteroidales bacterium]